MNNLADVKSSRLLQKRVTSASLKWELYLASYRFLPEWDCPHDLVQEAKGIKKKLKPPTLVRELDGLPQEKSIYSQIICLVVKLSATAMIKVALGKNSYGGRPEGQPLLWGRLGTAQRLAHGCSERLAVSAPQAHLLTSAAFGNCL